jgi:hypothetical protein
MDCGAEAPLCQRPEGARPMFWGPRAEQIGPLGCDREIKARRQATSLPLPPPEYESGANAPQSIYARSHPPRRAGPSRPARFDQGCRPRAGDTFTRLWRAPAPRAGMIRGTHRGREDGRAAVPAAVWGRGRECRRGGTPALPATASRRPCLSVRAHSPPRRTPYDAPAPATINPGPHPTACHDRVPGLTGSLASATLQ